tara:strand:- start:802 stop:1605 length:804 start_codon:yes stop_codon:yes gene_type:complete
MAKLVVVGIDGATLARVKPMAEAGELPNFKRLMAEGCWGILESQLPPITCPVWKSYSTGKNYAKLGSYGWIDVDFKEQRLRINTSKRFSKYREIWDYLGDANKTSGVINMPLTFPPEKIKGFFISGNAPNPDVNYTWPLELKKEITDKFNYKIPKSKLSLAVETPAVIKETVEVIKSKFDVAKEKINLVDFLQVIILRTDAREGLQRASILDLMPTILHLFGCKIPTDIDGRVLSEFFKKGSAAAMRPIEKRLPLAERSKDKTGEIG